MCYTKHVRRWLLPDLTRVVQQYLNEDECRLHALADFGAFQVQRYENVRWEALRDHVCWQLQSREGLGFTARLRRTSCGWRVRIKPCPRVYHDFHHPGI